MAENHPRPRILLVTPEISYLPAGMEGAVGGFSAKAGGLADVSASLVSALYELGADVHVALPNYRRIFQGDVFSLHERELRKYHEVLPDSHVHLAEDRIFYYRDQIYSRQQHEAMRMALIFQREVINHIVPSVRPDLIHCNDWTTALIPAMARRRGIKSLFTVHNIHTLQVSLSEIEESGIDAAEFWSHLYYFGYPRCYEHARSNLAVDLLASGIFSSHFTNTVSPRFLAEVVEGKHPIIPDAVRGELRQKQEAGCAFGILNAPDASYDPATDPALACRYGTHDVAAGKAENKRALQDRLGLLPDDHAPVFFWPSRLDPVQKGPELLTDILYRMVSDYWDRRLQVVVVADGPHQQWFRKIVRDFNLHQRVAVVDFEENLSRLAYAGSDFVLVPSLFEPCGLAQMIAQRYGTLPVVHATGGLHDTVRPLDFVNSAGNGFAFDRYASEELRSAVDRAVDFHAMPAGVRYREIQRVMDECRVTHSHRETARKYIGLYERMLARPLVDETGPVASGARPGVSQRRSRGRDGACVSSEYTGAVAG